MKKILALLPVLALAVSLAACGTAGSNTGTSESASPDVAESSTANNSGTTSPTEVPTETSGDGASASETKVLIAYFSATGTTKKLAEYAAAVLNADLYEIVPAEPYTSDDLSYNNSDCRANMEMNDETCRPEISGSVDNMADYDIVFIAYPIWWGQAPRIMSTFVESYDFSGKTVVTFCTSGSSANNDDTIKALAAGANWISGPRLSGSISQSEVADWIIGLGLNLEVQK